jgi:hypothetical protein
MTASLAVSPQHSCLQHPPESDYATFLTSAPSILGSESLKRRRQFVRAYPDLSAWLSAPLTERVGMTSPRSGPGYVCARSRPYLYYLVLRQRIQLDWPWIFAINYHELPPKLLPDPVNASIDSFTGQAAVLGYCSSGSRERVRRLIKYLHLHKPGRAHQGGRSSPYDHEDARPHEHRYDLGIRSTNRCNGSRGLSQGAWTWSSTGRATSGDITGRDDAAGLN